MEEGRALSCLPPPDPPFIKQRETSWWEAGCLCSSLGQGSLMRWICRWADDAPCHGSNGLNWTFGGHTEFLLSTDSAGHSQFPAHTRCLMDLMGSHCLAGGRRTSSITPFQSSGTKTCSRLATLIKEDLWEALDGAQACPTAILFFLLLAGSRDTQPSHGDVQVSPFLRPDLPGTVAGGQPGSPCEMEAQGVSSLHLSVSLPRGPAAPIRP
uniref:uncharacterized protein LOC129513939 n=1 Tax=Nyctereutes procyonoides TaxID=34880 RepID=UPI0024442AA8|nr:uncharacterized protein LOC129513939 [Nyctereutes procyonoides]